MDETPDSPSRSLPLTGILLVAVLILLVGLWVVQSRLRGEIREAAQQQAGRHEKLAARMDSLATRLAALEQAPRPDHDAAAALAPLTSNLQTLAGRLEELEKAAAAKKAEALPVVITPAVTPPARQSAEAALRALIFAAMTGKPYARELGAWSALSHTESTESPRLHAFAESGIPGEIDLIRQLRDALDHPGARPAVDDVSLVGKINTHLAGLVSIKQTTPADPYTALRAQLDHATLETLLGEVERLDEPARAPLAAWVGTVKTRAEVLAAFQQLDTRDGY